jgi:hypothetical protein
MAEIHIAGTPIRVGSKFRQLCAWCGHRLIDDDLGLMMVGPTADGSPGPGPMAFEVGALVEIEERGGVRRTAIVGAFSEPLRPGTCASERRLALVPNPGATDGA